MTWGKYKALWQEIDRRFGAGGYTAEEAVEAARQHRLIAPPGPTCRMTSAT